MVKHLPPSAATLRLWDVGGKAGPTLTSLRQDLDIVPVMASPANWDVEGTVDSIVAYDQDDVLSETFLEAALRVLRPGGRLIAIQRGARPTKTMVEQLEAAGHIRILVEGVGDDGVLLRGEKPHDTRNTLARIRQVADEDRDHAVLDAFPYVHLLIQQLPNKPVWKLGADEVITWRAAAVVQAETPTLLAFTSLPKAVSFMQQAVMRKLITDVNKVGKFSQRTAQSWDQSVIVNPPLEYLRDQTPVYIEMDPNTAEAPDE